MMEELRRAQEELENSKKNLEKARNEVEKEKKQVTEMFVQQFFAFNESIVVLMFVVI